MEKSQVDFTTLIGKGGEADIHAVYNRPHLAAKIYRKLPNDDDVRKFTFMVANPPIDPSAKNGRVSIAWLLELVTDSGRVIGFVMSRLDLQVIKPIFNYYIPANRRKQFPLFSYFALVRTAQNLSRAVRSVHSRGYVIGDVNESNVLVAEDAIITLVDTDSFQFNDGITTHRCTMGKPEYTPPELQGFSFRDVDRLVEHDLFGLGVLIFQLLMEGTHPFDGVFTGQGEAPEIKDRIKSGHFPHGKRSVPYKPKPLISFQMLPIALQELFLLCFDEGHRNPTARPTADMWVNTLGEFENNLTKCSVNEQHFYSNHLSYCPWCERTAKLAGRDPFPALSAIRSGQHLKPAAIGNAVGKPILKATSKSPPPTSKSLIPNSAPGTVITHQVIISTLQTPFQPQTNSQPSISSNLVSSNAQISSVFTAPTTKSGSNASHWKKLRVIAIGLISVVFFLIWQIPSKKLQTFKEHTGSVNSLVFSPDGKTITSGSADSTAKLWNLDGKELQTFKGHTFPVSSVAFSPDGKMIATGSLDSTVKLWNLDGKELQTFKGHTISVNSVAFSPDGKTIATGSGDGTIKLWDLDGKELQTFKGSTSAFLSLAFSPNGEMIASVNDDNRVKLWNLGGKELQTFPKGYTSYVFSVAFSPDGKTILTGGRDNTAKLWSLDGKELQTFKGHTSSVISVAYSPDGKTIATGSQDNTVKLWNIDGK